MSATVSRPRTRSRARVKTRPTLAGLLGRLGDVPPDRVRLVPFPGTATEADLLQYAAEDGTLYELVHGTLVEKAMGAGESKLEGWILYLLTEYLQDQNIGELMAGTGFVRLGEGRVRAPDVSFFLWENATSPEEDKKNPIARATPDLAVEVISRSNTPKEMAQKRDEYFAAGTRLVWQVYEDTQTIEVYTSPTKVRTLTLDDTLDGGGLLPGLELSVKRVFGRPTKPTKPAKPPKRKKS